MQCSMWCNSQLDDWPIQFNGKKLPNARMTPPSSMAVVILRESTCRVLSFVRKCVWGGVECFTTRSSTIGRSISTKKINDRRKKIRTTASTSSTAVVILRGSTYRVGISFHTKSGGWGRFLRPTPSLPKTIRKIAHHPPRTKLLPIWIYNIILLT